MIEIKERRDKLVRERGRKGLPSHSIAGSCQDGTPQRLSPLST